jgi:site-specific DNA-methyltransferase (adenine-specific)
MSAKPYYEDDLVTLWHGDCREHRAWVNADILITDPPYGMALQSSRGGELGNLEIVGDHSLELRDWVLQQWGTGKPALVFGRWSEPHPIGTKTVLTWEKGNHTGMGDLNIPWSPTTEEIYVLGKWPVRDVVRRSAATIAVNAPMPGKSNGRRHPTEKPLLLMERLVQKCPYGIIADPFAGSGPTLVAASLLGRRAIGVELDERYCEVIARRLSQQALDIDWEDEDAS